MREIVLAVAVVALPVVPALLVDLDDAPETLAGGSALPALSPAGTRGEAVFRRHCADCHGRLAQGGASGPSLLHPVYAAPGYPDAAFRTAIREGAPARLWSFGPMPPAPPIPAAQMDALIAYVRELQAASGL
jgi:mono/diheme cytochrome c family protein